MQQVELKHFQLFCGLGGAGKGFNRGRAQVGSLRAVYRCIGGVDCDPAGIVDFKRMTGVAGTVLDMFDEKQYRAWHGVAPPPGWRACTPFDIQRAAGGESPDVIFTSPPCKSFSGLLPQSVSTTSKYQALSQLTLRGIWLSLEAFKDDPPSFFILENVPRIMNRGRYLLDQIVGLLEHYGYAVRETTHCCGELGGLAESRKRFLLVARHKEKVPAFLYEPQKRPLKAVGDVLSEFPMPGDIEAGGPMHRIPSLQWKTWVRLAFVEAGSDWRSLNRLDVEDGYLKDYKLVPETMRHNGSLGVCHWDEHSGAITSRGLPNNGKFSVADPRATAFESGWGVIRFDQSAGTVGGQTFPSNGRFSVADPRFQGKEYSQYGVRDWNESTGAITSQRSPGQGAFSVADPRHHGPPKHNNQYKVVRFDGPTGTVTSAHGKGQCVSDPRVPGNPYSHVYRVVQFDHSSPSVTSANAGTAAAVADPRTGAYGQHYGKMRVEDWEKHAHTVTGSDRVGSGAMSIADPRVWPNRQHYFTGGHYGVVAWSGKSYAVSGAGKYDNGPWSVADPRGLPEPTDRLQAVIIAEDGTWHRPFTTLELAAIQGLIVPEDIFAFYGTSDSAHRERIGNAVPPPAAEAIASMMGEAILLSMTGETFQLSATPVWVRPVAVALTMKSLERETVDA